MHKCLSRWQRMLSILRSAMSFKQSIIFIVLCVFTTQHASAVTVYDLQLNNLLNMQQGLGWPHSLRVAVGHEAIMRLRRELTGQSQCTVTTPMGVTFNVNNPPSTRYERWGDGCGLRVRDVAASDEGRWRLTTTSGDDALTGWVEVYIEDDTSAYAAPTINLQDGDTGSIVELSTLENEYCMVAQPFSESTLVPGHCQVTLDHTTRAVQGNWNVLLGLPGKVEELHVQRRVSVNAERLDVGYVRDANTNKLNLYCNILHTTKNITFCRFQKTTSASGYNIMDGLSDGQHSYYGNGFDNRQCGMTLEHPSEQDYGTWRCSVGVQMWVGTTIIAQTPLQALISVAPNTRASKSIKTDLDSEGQTRTVFTQLGLEFTILCQADVSLRYCWFQHPNGSQFTPLPLNEEGQNFWYTGESLQVGDCGITLLSATYDEAGLWTCHMGPNNQVGLEVTDQVNVRVTGPLAANQNEIQTRIGDSITLYCHTANGIRPLDYCRFRTPTLLGLSIDASVTEENAILGRYYFTRGRDLDYGDCSLTISSVQSEDLGVWTCAALVDKDTAEASDTITLYIGDTSSSTQGVSQAGIAGMVIGLVAVLVALGGVVWYRRKKLFPRSNGTTDPTIAFSPRTISTSGSITSYNSSNSEFEIQIPNRPQ